MTGHTPPSAHESRGLNSAYSRGTHVPAEQAPTASEAPRRFP